MEKKYVLSRFIEFDSVRPSDLSPILSISKGTEGYNRGGVCVRVYLRGGVGLKVKLGEEIFRAIFCFSVLDSRVLFLSHILMAIWFYESEMIYLNRYV